MFVALISLTLQSTLLLQEHFHLRGVFLLVALLSPLAPINSGLRDLIVLFRQAL